MKKIILVLLVLLCGMSLFAETYTFYVGNSTYMRRFGDFKPLDSSGVRHHFTKIIMSSTGGNCYEVEVTSSETFTYQVYKGDVIPFNFKSGVREVLVTDIKPNKITLQVQE